MRMRVCVKVLSLLMFMNSSAYALQPWDQNPAYWEHEGAPRLLLGSSATDHLFLADGEGFPKNTVPPQLVLNLYDHLEVVQAIGANYVRNVMSQREGVVGTGGVPLEGPRVPFRKDGSGKFNLSLFNDQCTETVPTSASFGSSSVAIKTELEAALGSACYWTRFDAFLAATHNLGIFVQIELWDRFDYSDSNDSAHPEWDFWQKSPWRPANNSNYTPIESGLSDSEYNFGNIEEIQPFFHGVPGHPSYDSASQARKAQYDLVRGYQEAFVRKMLDYSLRYDHVLYLGNNETGTHMSWGLHWMKFIKDTAFNTHGGKIVHASDMPDWLFAVPVAGRTNPSSWGGANPFGQEDVTRYANNVAYNFLDISQADSNALSQYPGPHDNEPNYQQGIFDVVGRVQWHWDTVKYIMDNALGGVIRPVNHVKVYDGAHFYFGPGPNTGNHSLVNDLLLGAAGTRYHRRDQPSNLSILPYPNSIKSVRMVESKVKFWEIAPNNGLLSSRANGEAFVAAQDGEKYVLYFPEGGSVGLNLNSSTGEQFDLDWINYDNATWGSSALVAGGGIRTVTAPTTAAWIAVLTKQPSSGITEPLTVTLLGDGSGTVASNPLGLNCTSGVCSTGFSRETVVALSAIPKDGSELSVWGGDADCRDASVTMSTAVNCEATFALKDVSNNSPFPPALSSPAGGTTLASTTVTFVGGHTATDVMHSLWVGTTPGGKDLHFGPMSGHSQTVTGLPGSGTVYVRYWTTDNVDTSHGSSWVYTDAVYTMQVGSTAFPPALSSPAEGITLASTTVTFVGGHTATDVAHSLWVGTTPGGNNLHAGPMSGHSQTVTGLPRSGTVYVRYWTTDNIDTSHGSAWVYTDAVYTMSVH